MPPKSSVEDRGPRLLAPSVNVDARVIGDVFPQARTYEVLVPYSRQTIVVTPRAAEHSDQAVYVNGLPVSSGCPSGELPLDVGVNTFEISLRDAQGIATETLTLKVVRGHPTPDWIKISSGAPWAPRDSAGELVFKNRMWLIGGYLPAVVGDVWSSSDGTNWDFSGNLPDPSGVSVPLTYVHDDKMWVTTVSHKLYCSADGSTWTCALDALPWNGNLVFAGYLNGKLWGIGGTDGRQVWSSRNGVDWALELEGAPWSKRMLLGNVTCHAGKLWVVGGSYGRYQPFRAYRDVWCSDDGINWDLVTDCAPWEGRRWASCVSYQGRIWLFGGFRAQPTWQNFNDVWYSADGAEWKRLETETIWTPRHEISAYVFDGRLWVVGGNAWPLTNDVWQLYIPGLTFLTQPVLEEYVGARYEYRARADFNASLKPIKYRLVKAPEWLQIDAQTGVISGVPPARGTYRVVVEAFDDTGETAYQDYTLHVIEP
ncbi:MAG: putative Ig domain-containing protein [Armatimonadota bacterium]|nr:putative Ig domain-containing protein [Armatimonadota bacterium]